MYPSSIIRTADFAPAFDPLPAKFCGRVTLLAGSSSASLSEYWPDLRLTRIALK